VTAGLTEFVFGREHYFWAYIAGTSVNLIYNFTLHSRFTFTTQNRHAKHLAIFVGFNILSTLLQMLVVRELVRMIGTSYYIPIITTTILFFSLGSYVFFKRVLFTSRA
jgi:putative flippase GtrA